jgi:hypothetical protein
VLTGFTTSPPTCGWRSTTRPGGFGHILFDANSYLQVTASNQPLGPLNFTTGSLTISGWFKSTAGTFWVYCKAAGPTGIQFGLQPTGLSATIGDGTNTAFSPALSGVNDGAWHHGVVIVDRNAQTIRLVGDGKATGTASTATIGSLANSQLATLNALAPGAQMNVGALDAVRVWNRALSLTEAYAEFQLSLAGYPGVLSRHNPQSVASSSYTSCSFAALAGPVTFAGTATAALPPPATATFAAVAGPVTFTGMATAAVPPPATATFAAVAGPVTFAGQVLAHPGPGPDPDRGTSTRL